MTHSKGICFREIYQRNNHIKQRKFFTTSNIQLTALCDNLKRISEFIYCFLADIDLLVINCLLFNFAKI